jgi:tetratricopeptide (TPR) repeat protein
MKNARISLALLLAILMGRAVTTGGQTSRARGVPANTKATSQLNAAFDKAVKLGDEARLAERLDEAIESYTNALRIRPQWPEGWWYLGAIFYEKDLYAQGRDAFSNLVALAPKRGPAWGMLGLCEFQTRNYERAVISLQRARSLGFDGNQELESVVRYHTVLLYIRFEQFEIAYEILREFLRVGNYSPKIAEAFGLTLLRIPSLPNEVPTDKREEVLLAGQAGLSMGAQRLDEARKAFDTLLTGYPNDPNVHYSFGVFLMRQDADAALSEFRRVLEIEPLHQPAMVQMAFEYLKRRDYDTALPLAEKSVELAPRMYPARNVLGRVLLELGQTARAVKELEEGVRLAPSSPEMHFALARAYTRAGRQADAKREQETFKTLQAQYEAKDNSGSNSDNTTAKP